MTATLSPTAHAAIASIGGAHDLRLRTTLRRDDVDVWTSYDSAGGFYESMVRAPEDVYAAMGAVRMPTASRYATRAEAEAGHAQVCTRVGLLLQRRKAGAA